MPKLIVGLGNPGSRYARSRHNAGFLCLDHVASLLDLRFTRGRGRSEVAAGTVAGIAVVLARPQTYMNDSGESVAALMSYFRVARPDLLVVCDDLDRPFGAVRLRADGSSGGHNGLRSIAAHLHTQDFARLKIGIGRPPAGLSPETYVLQSFTASERTSLPAVLAVALEAIECWAGEGIVMAMNRYNGWSPP